MVPIPEIEQIETIAAHKFHLLVQSIDLIQIQVKHKHIIMEPVNLWRQTVVHYTGFVETGIELGCGHYVNIRIKQ